MTGLPPNTRTVGTPDPAGDMDAVVSSLAVITGATPGGPDPGSGTVTAQQAHDTLAGAVTTGQYVRGNGTHVVMSAIQAGDVPALSYAAQLAPTGTKTANYTAAAGDLVPCDTSGGSFTVTLPAAPAASSLVTIVLINGTNPVTVACGGADVFDKAAGITSVTLVYAGQALALQYRASGAIWYRAASHVPLPVPLTAGGTGQVTQQAALDAVAGAVTTGQYLRGNGTHVAMAAISAGDVPTLNQSTTGTASNVTGTVAVGNGGTGATTQQAAIDALAGAVTASQVLAGNGTHVTLRALAAADLPAATTGAQGATQFDTATPQPTSTAGSAGSGGKALQSTHVHAQNYAGAFGDGSDGAVNFDGTTTILGLVPAAGVYTLTRDIFCTTLQVGGGGTATTIITNGWRIFAQGTVTIAANGTVSAAGNAAATLSNNHGAGGTTGIGALGAGRPGGAGVATGTAGTGTASQGVGTGAPGAGGNGTTGTGGTSAGAAPGTGTGWLRTPYPVLTTALFNSSAVQRIDGGGGGSGGGGDGTNFGGGGGGGGGVVTINAWALVNNGAITAAGGNGGTPSTVAVNGGCGGGGGGAGGLVLTYTLSAPTGSGTTSVTGGTGGTKVTNGSGTGTNGGNGANGAALNIVLA